MTLYTHRHVRRGTRYVVVGEARAQCSTIPIQDGDMLTLYRGEDGVYSVRPPAEFSDGRFVEIFEEDGLPTMEQLRTQIRLLEMSQRALLHKLKRVREISKSRMMRLRKCGRLHMNGALRHDMLQWRKDWLEQNDTKDGTDCVTPFDKWLYTTAPVGSRHPLEAYADSYDQMSRTGDEMVSTHDVAVDIRLNMIPVTMPLPPWGDSDRVRQLDADGSEVGVSRQAVDEVLSYLNSPERESILTRIQEYAQGQVDCTASDGGVGTGFKRAMLDVIALVDRIKLGVGQ